VLSAVFLDLDHFKRINDTHGHATGDRVLRSVGNMIRDAIRPNDLAVRYGGEEFLIVLLSEDTDAAMTLAQRILGQMAAMRFEGVDGGVFGVSMSAGVAIHREGEAFETTFRRADGRLYRAKDGGRDAIVGSPALDPGAPSA
jgi:diguanylate cyclase